MKLIGQLIVKWSTEKIMVPKRKEVMILTLVFVFGSYSDDRVLNVFIFIDFGLVFSLVKVRRIVILVTYSNPDVLGNCGGRKEDRIDELR